MTFTAAVLSPFLLAALAPVVVAWRRGWSGWLLALGPAALCGWLYWLMPTEGAPLAVSLPWLPSLGIYLSFYADGLALLFAMLISGIGALILIYAGGYMAGSPHLGRMQAFLLLFMGSMLGVVLAGNLITLFVFWELTSVTSYLLIGFNHEQERSRRAALQALVVTGAGGLAMLAGFILLGQAAGSYELRDVLSAGEVVRTHLFYPAILVLVLAGAFTKSAQFPFHHWLPNAMEAPTPVSAYLHSATMVKAGVYLLARLSPVLGGTEMWSTSLTAFGAVTVVSACLIAVVKTDLKQLLAYSTVASLGLMTMLLGIGSPYAVKGALVFLTAHALYKGALFMVAGCLDHKAGTRDASELSGLRKAMPVTAVAGILSALCMAAFGPWLSFIGKEILMEGVLATGSMILVGVAVLSGAAFAMIAVLTGFRPFVGLVAEAHESVHEAPVAMWLGPLILSAKGAAMGLVSAPAAVVLGLAASSVLGRATDVHLSLWHGLNTALGLSALSIAAGLMAAARWASVRAAVAPVENRLTWGPDRLYDSWMSAVIALARAQTRLLQSGYLRYYIMAVILSAVGLTGLTLIQRGEAIALAGIGQVRPYEWALAGLVVLSAVAAVAARSLLAAIVALGGVGAGVALLFVVYSAPDLAMTQFLVETLTLILFMLVFYRLPKFATLSSSRSRIRDALLAISAGLMMTVLVLIAVNVQVQPGISYYFADNAVPLGKGRNVVNVILVDFRALDTLGEITVLALAAVGVSALMKLRKQEGGTA